MVINTITYGFPPACSPKAAGLKAECWSNGGLGKPFSRPNPGPGRGPGNPGIPNGGPGSPPGFSPAAAAAAAAAADVGVVEGLGVVGFSLPGSVDFFPDGAVVEDAEDLPLLGLTGSFFALRSPFSLGGVRLSPFVKAAES